MLHSSSQSLRVMVLLALCLTIPNLALSQSTFLDAEKVEVVRAVLKSEQARQERTFESVTQLSTASLASLITARLAADFQLTLVTSDEIKEKAQDYIGAHYLAFKDFRIEGERGVVKLAVAKEVTPCFGPYQKYEKEMTYRLKKTDREWSAELVGNPLGNPVFGVKPNNGLHPTANSVDVLRKTPCLVC